MPKESAASTDDWVSSALTPSTANADCPERSTRAGINRAEGVLQVGAAAEMLDLEAAILAQQNALEARADTAPAAMRFKVPVRRSRSAQISSSLGCACPNRTTFRRRVRPFTSASSTRRTVLRSSDHKCRMHLPSPETEYLAVAKSNRTSPSSTATASGAPARNCSSILARRLAEMAEGCMVAILRD